MNLPKRYEEDFNEIYQSRRNIPPYEYELFMENDSELAYKYGNDIEFLKRNNAESK